jgi:hypothetical protein
MQLFMGYFLFLAIVEAIKVVRVNKLRKLHPAKGTAYPSSDLFLDNVVMVSADRSSPRFIRIHFEPISL